MILPENHFSLTSAQDVIQLCQPLFDATDINNVYYSRMYDDGRSTALVTNPYFHKHFWEKRYSIAAFPLFHEGVVLTELYGQAHSIDAKNFFNMDYMFLMISRKSEYYEILGFTTYTGNDAIVSFYLNNIDLLENFGLYFREKAAGLIAQTEKSPILTASYDHQIIQRNTNNLQAKKNSLASLVPENYTLQCNSDSMSISRKEYLTMMNLSQGKSAKEIATIHHVSNRTIESRLAKLKDKLGCNAKSQLIEFFFSNFKL